MTDMDTIQLQNWVQRMQSGDLKARDELLRTVCRRLERLARKMLQGFPNVACWCETGDVLQNALVRLFNGVGALEIGSTRHFFNLAAFHIRNELLDLARHYRRHDYQALQAPPGDPDTAELMAAMPDRRDPEEELELWEQFHEAIENLPATEREVISLIFYHGWTQAQIAELFQMSERNVRRYYQEACVLLSDALAGELPLT